jgi:hypothetical protein
MGVVCRFVTHPRTSACGVWRRRKMKARSRVGYDCGGVVVAGSGHG